MKFNFKILGSCFIASALICFAHFSLASKGNTMNIKSVTLRHTNPSMGPHEVQVTISLAHTKDHNSEFENFLQNTKVNSLISLNDYIKARVNKDQKTLDKVHTNFKSHDLNEGEEISHLTLYLEDNLNIEFQDVYRQWNLSGYFYPTFTSYMVKHGIRSEISSMDELEEK